MPEELLPQDMEVLNRMAFNCGYKTWKEFMCQESNKVFWVVEDAVVLARQAENARCLKEIDKLQKEIYERDELGNFVRDTDAIKFNTLEKLKKRLQENEKRG